MSSNRLIILRAAPATQPVKTPKEDDIITDVAHYISTEAEEAIKTVEQEIDAETITDENIVDIKETKMDISTLPRIENAHPVDEVDDTVCPYCTKRFTSSSNVQRHIRRIHKIEVRAPATNIKCIECNIVFNQIYQLRDHLEVKHNLKMPLEELTFVNMDEFYRWKCETERKNMVSYVLKHGVKRGLEGHRHFYSCHRSGIYNPKVRGSRKRMIKTQGSCKLGIVCTSTILALETEKEVVVKYYANHYGHGNETTLIKISPEEQSAIAASVSNGVPFEEMLDDIRDAQTHKDHFHLYVMKKKDIRSINCAYNTGDYFPNISDIESVNNWVQSCCQMENSPILFYKHEEYSTEKGNHDEFTLVIMTEYQKHILQASAKKVISLDSVHRKKGGRFYLTVLFVLDEHDLAFPVAFCISSRVDKEVTVTFLQAVKESAGTLEAEYLMTDNETQYYDSWQEVMGCSTKWLWSTWYLDSKWRVQLRIFKGKTEKRSEVYKTMRKLLECQNQSVFNYMLESFVSSLLADPESKDLGHFMQQNYASNPEMWAYCFRRDIELSINVHFEIMHRTFRYCCREGRKKRLDKFIFVIMKLVRDKILERLANISEDKRILAAHNINWCHKIGLKIPSENVNKIDDKEWHVECEGESFYVAQECTKCPEHCNLICDNCDICVHMYMCTCINNLINANLCEHIHAVAWNYMAPQFSSNDPEMFWEEPNTPSAVEENTSHGDTGLVKGVLNKAHELYKIVKSKKSELDNDSLNVIMQHLNDAIDICLADEQSTNVMLPDQQNHTATVVKPTSSAVAHSKNSVTPSTLTLPPYFVIIQNNKTK